jgi:hypothetical protein
MSKTPEHLKHLPSELVTDDIEDPDKIYKTDAPHIIQAITQDTVDERKRKEQGIQTPQQEQQQKAQAAGVGTVKKLTSFPSGRRQFQVDLVRLRIISSLVDRYIAEVKALVEPKIKPKHIWFPEDNLNRYELRDGNAPSDSHRPQWLQRMRLEIDIHNIPQTIQDYLEKEKVHA